MFSTAAVGAHWQIGSGTPTFDTTTFRNGAAALRVNPTAGIRSTLINPTLSGTVLVARFAINIATGPNADNTLAALVPSGGIFGGLTYHNADSKWYAGFDDGATVTLGATGTTIGAGWHVIDVRLNVVANPWLCDVQVDGVALAQASLAQAADSFGATPFQLRNLHSATYDIYFDDLIISQTSADYPIGDGKVLAFVPASDGTHTATSTHIVKGTAATPVGAAITSATTDAFNWMNGRPIGGGATDATRLINQQTLLSTEYVELAIEQTTETAAPRAVEMLVMDQQATTAVGDMHIKINDNGTETVILDRTAVAGVVTDRFTTKQFATMPTGGGAWTLARFKALKFRFGYSTDATPDQYWRGAMIEAEFAAVSANPFILRADPNPVGTMVLPRTFNSVYAGFAYQPRPSEQYLVQMVQFDAATDSPYEASLSSYSFTHAVGLMPSRFLMVAVSIFVTGSVTALTYNGKPLTFLRADTVGVYRTEVWYMSNPDSGANSVAVTLSASLTSIASAASYWNVDQAQPISTQAGATGTGGTVQISLTPPDDRSFMVGALTTSDASGVTTSAPTIERGNNSGALGTASLGERGEVTPAGSTTETWTGVSGIDSWTISAVAIRPAFPWPPPGALSINRDFPNPVKWATRSAAYIDYRTYLNSYTLSLIGQDTFYGGPGQGPPNFDWPVPKGPRWPIEIRTWLQSYLLTLIGKDALPFRLTEWPNPLPTRWASDLRGWLQNALTTTLAPILQAPFFQLDWPNPFLYRSKHQDHQWWYTLSLIAQDLLPFSQNDWPAPKGYPALTNLRTWLYDVIRFTLPGQDVLPFSLDNWPNPLRPIQPALSWIQSLVTTTLSVIVQNPFALLDWPNPPRRVHPHQGFVDWFKQQLIGQDVLPFRLSEWPNPLRARSIDALTWLQNLVNTTLVPVITLPFAQLDWPNPQIPKRANDLLRWTQTYLQTLIGQDVLPKRLLDWPNPLRRTHPHQGFLATFLRTLIGADVLPFRQRDWPLPVRKAEQVRGWVVQAFVALVTFVGPMPFRQLEWPVPLRWGQLRQRFPFLPQFRPPTTITTVPNARMVAQQTDFPFAYVSKVNCVEAENLTIEWSFKIYTGSSSFSSGVRVTQTVGEGIIASTSVNVRVTQTVVEVITHA